MLLSYDINMVTLIVTSIATMVYTEGDLVYRGAKIDKHDKDNFSPLLFAACNGHAETIQRLLSKGADLYAVDKNDKTAIYWTAAEDNIEALNVNICIAFKVYTGVLNFHLPYIYLKIRLI